MAIFHDIEEVTEKAVRFFDTFCPFEFVEDSPLGTYASAVADVAKQLTTRDGITNMINCLTEYMNDLFIPTYEEDPDDYWNSDLKDQAEDLLDDLQELLNHTEK